MIPQCSAGSVLHGVQGYDDSTVGSNYTDFHACGVIWNMPTRLQIPENGQGQEKVSWPSDISYIGHKVTIT